MAEEAPSPEVVDDVLAALAGDDVSVALARIASSLRAFHATAPETCPWPAGPDVLVARAAARVEAGVVNSTDFDAPYQRHTPAALLGVITGSVPDPPEHPVVTHGRAGLAALRVDGGELRWTDVGQAGVGDRYRDLATIAPDLVAAISPSALGPFLDAYGVDQPDLARLDWYITLDQLLR